MRYLVSGAAFAVPAVYLFGAEHFDPAIFLILLTGQAIIAACLFWSWRTGVWPVAAMSLAMMFGYIGAIYPHPGSVAWSYEHLSRYFAPTIRGELSQNFSEPLSDIYIGGVRGWYVGAWGAKGPPQANFDYSAESGADGSPGFIILNSGAQAYFEYMPATLQVPKYYDLRGGLFSLELKAIGEYQASGTPHLFVCGGFYSCYYHKDPLVIGKQWTKNERTLDPAAFVPEHSFASIGAENVLARVGYIGVMFISPQGSRNDVNLKGRIGIDDFHFASR